MLFGDLVGFTSLSEERDQEEVRELLSGYFEECRLIITRYGGTVEKFIGDAVMAVWGVPTAHEDDAERAVRAGLELVNRVADLGGDLGVPDLSMRVGIVTGEVAVTVGAEHQGMVAGDAVNTASRVQSAATPGQVWVDETTRLLTTSSISYVDVGSHALKGKAEPLPLWSVRAVVAGLGGGQRADGLEAPHVGRDRELRLVKEIFHGAEESGRPAMLVVAGEPGVGKTRLGWEFSKYTDGLQGTVRWHSGRCLAYGEGVAYYALAEAVRGRLNSLRAEGSESDDDGDQAALLALGLAEYISDAEERAWLEPRLGALLGIGGLGTFPREDLFNAWTTFFARVSGEGDPVVLVIEDGQHADDGLVGFLEHLMAVASFPLFVLLLARQGLLESRPALATNRRVTILHLDALGTGDMGALVDGLVQGLPDSIRTSLVARAEGIPLFAVETVRSLIDRDLVVPRGGRYVLHDAESLDLEEISAPASLQALLAARLDTLAAEQRLVIDRASVLGASFSREVIAQLCPEVDDLGATLAALVRHQLLRQESDRLAADFGRYHFVQSGMRQVAYGTLARRDRKAIHLTAVQVLEDDDNSAGETSPVIAKHLLSAIDAIPEAQDVAALTSRLLTHLQLAARRSAALGSPGEAAGHLRLALTRCTDAAGALAIESALAEQLDRSGQTESAIEHATHAIAGLEELGDELSAARTAVTLARSVSYARAEFEQAIALTTHWIERVHGREDAAKVELQLVGARLGSMLRAGVDFREEAEHHVILADRVGGRFDLADSYISLALHHQSRGARRLSRLLLDAAGEIARELHDPLLLCRVLANLNADLNGDDATSAAGYGREAVEVAAVTGDVTWVSVTAINLGEALLVTGEWDHLLTELGSTSLIYADEAYDALFRAQIADARGADHESPDLGDQEAMEEDVAVQAITRLLAVRKATLGGESDVSGLVEVARLAFQPSGFHDDFPVIWRAALELAWAAGDRGVVDEILDVVDADRVNRRPAGVRAQLARMLGLIAMADGADTEVVEGHFATALAAAREWGAAPMVAQCEGDLGAWLVAQGRASEGEALVARARTTFDELGARAWSAALDERLAGAMA